MAAEVSALMRFLDGGDTHESGKSTAHMMTMDLLGGCYNNITPSSSSSSYSSSSSSSSSLESKELDLDLQVPCGWEKRLDLKSGNIYLKRCNNSTLLHLSSSSSTSDHHNHNYKPRNTNKLLLPADLTSPPKLPPKQTIAASLFDDKTLDLNFASSSSITYNQSVCTLDKVKTALERAQKENYCCARKRSISCSNSKSRSSPHNSNSSSSIRDRDLSAYDDGDRSSSSFASGCPSCLMYVLISTSDPKCPRCNSIVPLPPVVKKPRIDLNIAI